MFKQKFKLDREDAYDIYGLGVFPGELHSNPIFTYDHEKEKKEMMHDPNALANTLVYFDGNYYSADSVTIDNRPFANTKLDISCYLNPSNRRKAPGKQVVPNLFEIKKVIVNGPATIVLWVDGTKTVVKCENENFDHEKGLAMAIAKKALGNQGNYYNTIRKWIPEEPVEEEPTIDPAMAAVMSTFLGGH